MAVKDLVNIPNFEDTFNKDKCLKLDGSAHPFYLVQTAGKCI